MHTRMAHRLVIDRDVAIYPLPLFIPAYSHEFFQLSLATVCNMKDNMELPRNFNFRTPQSKSTAHEEMPSILLDVLIKVEHV